MFDHKAHAHRFAAQSIVGIKGADAASVVSSARFARPSHTLLTMVVPSSSTQSLEPLKGCTRRRKCVFHAPISKSKSCCPSRRSVVGSRCPSWRSAVGCGCAEAITPKVKALSSAPIPKALNNFIGKSCGMLWYFKKSTIYVFRNTTFEQPGAAFAPDLPLVSPGDSAAPHEQ